MKNAEFRAWNTEKEEWIDQSTIFMLGNGNMGLLDVDDKFPEAAICFFSGIYDDSGAKIFEADVLQLVKDSKSYSGVVKFYNGAFYLLTEPTKICIHMVEKISFLKVLGNIFNNPELLEDECVSELN